MGGFFRPRAAHGLPAANISLIPLIGRGSDLILDRGRVGRPGTGAIHPDVVLDVVGGHRPLERPARQCPHGADMDNQATLEPAIIRSKDKSIYFWA